MKIAVIAGGLSPERDVSLTSGSLIANSLMRSGHDVVLLDVCMKVDPDSPEADFSKTRKYSYMVPETEPDLDAIRTEADCGNALIGEGVVDVCKRADLVFIALHGAMGENGQIQAVFDSYGIKYTGSPYDGCLLAMDKWLTKLMLSHTDVDFPESVLTSVENAKDVADTFGFPCVIKPCSCGSSCGVSLIHSVDELESALKLVEKYEDSVIIEKFISGREFSCGILKGTALPPIEIKPKAGFYDYKNKYQKGLTEELCPAPITEAQDKQIREAALAVHKALRLGTYSRSDFILDEATGKFYCLEANTLPGMTPTSLFPQEAAAVGIDYDTLCETVALDALK